MRNEDLPEELDEKTKRRKNLITSIESKIYNENFDWLVNNGCVKFYMKYPDPLETVPFTEIIDEFKNSLAELDENELKELEIWLMGIPFRLLDEIQNDKQINIEKKHTLWEPGKLQQERMKATILSMMIKQIKILKDAVSELKKVREGG